MGLSSFTSSVSKKLHSLSQTQIATIIFSSSLVLFVPFLGRTHLFDWDEINFAECAREMLVTGNYLSVQIDFQPFWEKPPLFIWMQVLSMKLFGINEFAARFPNAFCGAVTLSSLYLIGENLRSRAFGLLWAACFLCSFLPHFYFHSGIIDPWFNLLIGFSLVGLYAFFILKKKPYILILSAVAAGLAVLTKGPVALLVIGGVSFLFACFNFKIILTRWTYLFLWAAFAIITGLTWFIWLWLSGYESIIVEFVKYQIRLFSEGEAGHAQPWFYHSVVLFFGCFPISIPALAGMVLYFKYKKNTNFDCFSLLMLIFFGFVLVLFSIVTTKIVHYSSLCYFPITFFAAEWFISNEYKTLVLHYITIVLGIITGIAIFSLPFIGIYISDHFNSIAESGIIKDEFALQNLRAEANWTFFDAIPGLILLVGVLLFIYFILKKNYHTSYAVLFVSTLLMLLSALPLIVPKIEKITQGAAIEYYVSKQNQNISVIPLDYKSYAQYFYTQKQPVIALDTAYISKITNKNNILKEKLMLKVVWEKNGFVGYE